MIRYNGIEIDRKSMTISHAGVAVRQPYSGPQTYFKSPQGGGYRFKAMERMILGEVSRDGLFDYIFSDCPEGGPAIGPHVIDIRFIQWKKIFARLQLKLVRDKRAGTMYFRLIPDVV